MEIGRSNTTYGLSKLATKTGLVTECGGGGLTCSNGEGEDLHECLAKPIVHTQDEHMWSTTQGGDVHLIHTVRRVACGAQRVKVMGGQGVKVMGGTGC